jgi:cellulose synthase/poly-beta-1,6-N-acetylglucosamine synthase-like glycosyltransferase
MALLVSRINTDIIIFTDANVLLDPTSVRPMLDYFRDPQVGGVAGTLKYINANESVTAEVGTAYWRLEEEVKRLESRCGSIMGADGSIFALRRTHYPAVPPHLLDDMISSMGMIFAGLRLISAPDVIAYERNTTASADEFRRKRRIACRAFNSHKHVWPMVQALGPVEVYKYVSHKLVRWLGALWLGLAALCTALAMTATGLGPLVALGLPVAAGLIVLGGRRQVPVVTPVVEILTAIWATFVGVSDSFRGKTYQTWTPAASR